MAKIQLDPATVEKLKATALELEERGKQLEALNKVGAVPPSLMKAHQDLVALNNALLENFVG